MDIHFQVRRLCDFQADYSQEHREAMEAIVTGFVDQITAGVAEARHLTQQQVHHHS